LNRPRGTDRSAGVAALLALGDASYENRREQALRTRLPESRLDRVRGADPHALPASGAQVEEAVLGHRGRGTHELGVLQPIPLGAKQARGRGLHQGEPARAEGEPAERPPPGELVLAVHAGLGLGQSASDREAHRLGRATDFALVARDALPGAVVVAIPVDAAHLAATLASAAVNAGVGHLPADQRPPREQSEEAPQGAEIPAPEPALHRRQGDDAHHHAEGNEAGSAEARLTGANADATGGQGTVQLAQGFVREGRGRRLDRNGDGSMGRADGIQEQQGLIGEDRRAQGTGEDDVLHRTPPIAPGLGPRRRPALAVEQPLHDVDEGPEGTEPAAIEAAEQHGDQDDDPADNEAFIDEGSAGEHRRGADQRTGVEEELRRDVAHRVPVLRRHDRQVDEQAEHDELNPSAEAPCRDGTLAAEWNTHGPAVQS